MQGLHSTEVAFLLLTQQPRFDSQCSPKKFSGIFQCSWDLLTGLRRVKRTEARNCQPNPYSTSECQASTMKNSLKNTRRKRSWPASASGWRLRAAPRCRSSRTCPSRGSPSWPRSSSASSRSGIKSNKTFSKTVQLLFITGRWHG